MHTKTAFISLVFLVVVSFTAFNCLAEDIEPLSRQEILTLLPRGIDVDDDDRARYKKLLEQGPAVHEVLGEELLRVDDWITAGRILGIFEDSSGDKSVALKYIKRFLELPRSNDGMWASVRSQAVKAVNKLQQSQDSNILRTTDKPSRELSSTTPPTNELPKNSSSPRVVATSSIPWSIIVVMGIAAFGLLLLLFKSRK